MANLKSATVEELLSRPWSREFVPDDGLISARVPELPGCFAAGTTWEEAHTNLEEALEAWLTAAVELGNEVPEPRGDEGPDEVSGRFSVRVPRYIHRRLANRAEAEGCSLNQLVATLLAESVEKPVRQQDTDAYEDITSDAVSDRSDAIGALKGIGTFLRDRGDINLACLVYAFAAERAAVGSGGAQEAAKEFGTAGALARRERRLRLAESLWRQSLRRDQANIRSRSSLGQLLHHQGRYEEAADLLEPVADVDNYAGLFLGWSRLQLGLSDEKKDLVDQGLADLTVALRRWCAYASRGERSSWLRQLRRLNLLGSRFRDEADQLVQFANSNANWPRISADEVEDSSKLDEDELDPVIESQSDAASAGGRR
ncbi:MAG: type II toxin-antitoxin system HicB family antitoxin [Acidimicrobiales bacterium]